MLTPVHHRKHLHWAREHQNWTTEQCNIVAWSDKSCFYLHHVDSQVCVRVRTWGRNDTWTHLLEEGRSEEAMGRSAEKPWGIHMDVSLTCTTFLNLAADQIHPFMQRGELF